MKYIHVITVALYFLCSNSARSVENSCLAVGWGSKERHIPPTNDTRKCLLSLQPSKFVALIARVVVGLPNAGSCGGGRGGCAMGRLKSYNADARKYGTDWPPFGTSFFTLIILYAPATIYIRYNIFSLLDLEDIPWWVVPD